MSSVANSTNRRGLSTANVPWSNVATPVIMVSLYWAAYVGIGLSDLPMFTTFLWRLAVLLLVTIAMTIWWVMNRRIGWKERLLIPTITIASATAATFLLHKTVMAGSVVILSWQALLTLWTIWLVITRSAPAMVRQIGFVALGILCWIPMTQTRMEGMRGDGAADLRWRWTPTAEEKMLAERKNVPPPTSETPAAVGDEGAPTGEVERVELQPGDWPAFRGPQRNGIVQGIKINTDWTTSPPREIWRKPVGPAWSSVAIVDGLLFTQEQRGPEEMVVCYDANTGEEKWTHVNQTRFEESLGGIGPRSTPTFHDGKIYAQGASGWLNCLDARTGELKWAVNIADAANTDLPVWGYSISPVVVDGVVVTYAGNKPKKAVAGTAPPAGATPGVLAYDAESGQPNGNLQWHAAIGKESYASPQLITLQVDGNENEQTEVTQLLYLSDAELTSFEAATGKQLWNFKSTGMGRPTVQPQLVGENQIVISFAPDPGVMLLEVTLAGETWSVTEKWASRNMKPDFSDYVYHDGYLYGFDNDIFCCISLADGKRMWKKGRYGAGQALLLADQPVLLVITEQGELVLVATNSKRHEELAKFPAITGKTWNHPVIAHGKLYVRNAEEMACFEITSLEE